VEQTDPPRGSFEETAVRVFETIEKTGYSGAVETDSDSEKGAEHALQPKSCRHAVTSLVRAMIDSR